MAILENFAEGRYFGTPTLDYYGMTVEPRRAAAEGIAGYPAMSSWLRTRGQAGLSQPE